MKYLPKKQIRIDIIFFPSGYLSETLYVAFGGNGHSKEGAAICAFNMEEAQNEFRNAIYNCYQGSSGKTLPDIPWFSNSQCVYSVSAQLTTNIFSV